MFRPLRLISIPALSLLLTACGSSAANDKSTTPTLAASASAVAPEATSALASAPEEDFSAWIGTYPFEEATTGFAWVYQIKIEKTPDGYRAHLTIDGNQVATRLLCTLRKAGPNKIDLLHLQEEAGHLGGPHELREHLLSLEGPGGGKAEYRWAAIKPNIEKPKEGPAEIGDANSYVKKYPVDFLSVKTVKARLDKLLGLAEHKRLDEFIATQDVIKKNGDMLEMEGFYPHSGGSKKALVLYDIKNNRLHVLLFDEEKNTLDVFNENAVDSSKVVENKIKAWKLLGMKVSVQLKIAR